jgi:hypothetical protein
MIIPCIDALKICINPTNAHNLYYIVKLLKQLKIVKVASTCFGLHKISPGSYSQRLAKITIVILAKHWLWLPDDGLCKPKHVGAAFMIFKYFNSLTI